MTLLMFQITMCLVLGAIMMLALIAFGTLFVLEMQLVINSRQRAKRRIKR